MSWGNFGDWFTNNDASDASQEAGQAAESAYGTMAQYQEAGLENFIASQAQPEIYRRGSMNMLAGAYGGGEGQQTIIQNAMQSPLYGQIMGGKKAGEEAILRNASATGGLRSGNVQGAMYDYNTQLENKALLDSYNQQISGLQGFANMNDPSAMIYDATTRIGQTYGQGQLAAVEGDVAAAQAMQDERQQGYENLMGYGNLALSAYDSGMFSDRRLKENIKLIGKEKGHNIYSWEWNSIANKLGMAGGSIGCLAEEVYAKNKNDVVMKDGWMFVLYGNLDIMRRSS